MPTNPNTTSPTIRSIQSKLKTKLPFVIEKIRASDRANGRSLESNETNNQLIKSNGKHIASKRQNLYQNQPNIKINFNENGMNE